MASAVTLNPPSDGVGGNNFNADPSYKPVLKPMAPRRQLGKMAFREQDVMHMRKQLSGEAEGGVLGYIADHYRPDYGKHTHVVEQLRFTNLDLSALLSDKKSFGALQKSLRKQGAITNQLLEQGLAFFIMNNRAFLMQRLEQQRREEERKQRMLEEQALLAMLEEENRKYEQEMLRMQSKDYNPEDDEVEEESESTRQEEERGTLFKASPTTATEAPQTTSTTPTNISPGPASRVYNFGSIAEQHQVDLSKLDLKPINSGRDYLMFAQALGGGLGQIELDSDDDEDKEIAEEQKRHEEWKRKQKEREEQIKRLREKVEATKKVREKLAAAKKMRLNADRKKRESIKVMSSADQEEVKKSAKPRRSISREFAMEALKDSDSQAAMKQMRDKMASYKKKKPVNTSIRTPSSSAEKLPSLTEGNGLITSSESGDSEEKKRIARRDRLASGYKTLSEASDAKEKMRNIRKQKTGPAVMQSSSTSSSSRRNSKEKSEKEPPIRRTNSSASSTSTSSRRNSKEKSEKETPIRRTHSSASSTSNKKISEEKSEKRPPRRSNSLSCESNRAALVADAVDRVTEAKEAEAKEASNNNSTTTPKRSPRRKNYGRLSVNVKVLKDSSMRDDSLMNASSKQDNCSTKEEDKTDA